MPVTCLTRNMIASLACPEADSRDPLQRVIMDHWTPDPGIVAPTAGLEQVGRQQAAKPGR
jgi:hypothetical protein